MKSDLFLVCKSNQTVQVRKEKFYPRRNHSELLVAVNTWEVDENVSSFKGVAVKFSESVPFRTKVITEVIRGPAKRTPAKGELAKSSKRKKISRKRKSFVTACAPTLNKAFAESS